MNQFIKRDKRSKRNRAPAVKDSPAGAVQAAPRFGKRVDSWLRSHRVNGRESLIGLIAEPVKSLMTVLVIAIAMALPAVLVIALLSLQQLGGNWQSSARINVFISMGAPPAVVQRLQDFVHTLADIEQVKYISPEAALEEFEQASQFGEALELLEANPLPPMLLLTPQLQLLADSGKLSTMIDELGKLPDVDEVQLDMQWLQRMQEMLEVGRKIAVLLGSMLAVGVLLVLGNTIRLAIESRRDEIRVVKLVGGTNAFVRRPFLYTGLWYGLFGGVFAWVGIALGGLWLDSSIARLADLYKSDFALVGLGFNGLLILMFLGGVLGLLGAALAVGRHIAAIEP